VSAAGAFLLNNFRPRFHPGTRLFCIPPLEISAMAFAIRNLSVLAYAQGFTLWHYKGRAMSLAQTASAGFFDAASDVLSPGDMLMVSASDGGRIVVVAATNGGVATAPLG
jgi:hypothetical protein